MLLKKVFAGKQRISVDCNIKIVLVSEIPSSKTNNNCGGNIFVEWTKGRRTKDHGETKRTLCKAKDIEFNEEVAFATHILRDGKTGACDRKPLLFSLKYCPMESSRPKTLGEAEVDLAEFCKNSSFEGRREVSFFRKKKDIRATLHVEIKTKWTKINKKPYVEGSQLLEADSSATTSTAEDTQDLSESELTNMSDSDLHGSMDDLEEDEEEDDISGTSPAGTASAAATASSNFSPSPRSGSRKRSSSKIASTPTAATAALDSDHAHGGTPKASVDSDNSDNSGKEAKKDSKEKRSKRPKKRPTSAEMGKLNLDAIQENSVFSVKDSRPLASHSSLNAIGLSPSGPLTTAKKQRRRSLDPVAPHVVEASAKSANAPDPTTSPRGGSSSSMEAGRTTPPDHRGSSSSEGIADHTEQKIQQEVEMAHEEVRQLRKELIAAQQKLRAAGQEKQRLLAIANQAQQNQENQALQELFLRQQSTLKEYETKILCLESELRASRSPRRQQPVSLKPLLRREEERSILMVVFMFLLVLSTWIFLTMGCSSTASQDQSTIVDLTSSAAAAAAGMDPVPVNLPS